MNAQNRLPKFGSGKNPFAPPGTEGTRGTDTAKTAAASKTELAQMVTPSLFEPERGSTEPAVAVAATAMTALAPQPESTALAPCETKAAAPQEATPALPPASVEPQATPALPAPARRPALPNEWGNWCFRQVVQGFILTMLGVEGARAKALDAKRWILAVVVPAKRNAASAPAKKALPLAGWLKQLNPRQFLPARPPAGARPNHSPVQAELSLDRVKVVRNDLSEADLEVVPMRLVEKPVEAMTTAQPQAAMVMQPTRWTRWSSIFAGTGETKSH